VCAFVNGERAALKIRRDDTDKDRIYHEGVMLKKANKVNVGPTLLATTKNFLLMRFINGDLFPEWLIRQEEKEPIETVLRDVLEKGWILDSAQIDHGELSYASKHIIVDHENQPFLVDFETASINRRSKNVTSICQYFFMSGKVAEIISGKTGVRDKRSIVEMLKRYKRTKTRQDFKAVLSACCL
jgi:putative serine/threonine protein kinase